MINRFPRKSTENHNRPSRMPTITALPSEGLVRLPQVLSVYPVSRSTWWAGIKTGRFPKPVRLGPRTVAWRVDEIRELVAAAESGGAQ
jgi:prophage regulatory protein